MRPEAHPAITIVMCTYNGAKFLEEQLQSFLVQSHTDWRLYVSDDGSADGTVGLLHGFRESVGNTHQIDLVSSTRRGISANFLKAICDAPLSDFCAISDQDDIWQPNKLKRALERLAQTCPGRPALYCARTRIVDVRGRELRLSPLFTRHPCFANALVQNIAGGNTMVMNRAAHELVRRAGADLDVVAHDWWLYQLISGAGGEVIYDTEPHTLYRQHGGNAVGENSSVSARIKRSKDLMNGVFKSWMDRNLFALERVKDLLTIDNQRLLSHLVVLRQQSIGRRVSGIRKLGIRRQTLLGDISLTVAAALGRF